jgi:rRNA maturation endonuclease Nob1
MLGSGSETHHWYVTPSCLCKLAPLVNINSPVCHTTAKTRCVKQEHLAICPGCHKAFSLQHNNECPSCEGKKEKEARRKAREKEEEERRQAKGKKGRKE